MIGVKPLVSSISIDANALTKKRIEFPQELNCIICTMQCK